MEFSSLKRRLYLLGFVDEFGPVYAVYTLWFNDNGSRRRKCPPCSSCGPRSPWRSRSRAERWPIASTGRRLLATAFTVRALGISVWLIWPTFTGVLIGAAMWATHDAVASGSWEAMIHDELTAVDRADAYQSVMARIGQFSHIGIAAGTIVGAVLLRLDVGLEASAGSRWPHTSVPRRWSPRSPMSDGWWRDTAEHVDGDRAIGAGPVAGATLQDIAVSAAATEHGRPTVGGRSSDRACATRATTG